MIFAIVSGLTLIAITIGLDIYFAVDGVKGNTWSEMMHKMAFISTFIPWAWGILAGHFFNPEWQPLLKQPAGIALLIWLSILVSCIGAVLLKSSFSHLNWVPIVVCLLAVLVGAKLWPV